MGLLCRTRSSSAYSPGCPSPQPPHTLLPCGSLALADKGFMRFLLAPQGQAEAGKVAGML